MKILKVKCDICNKKKDLWFDGEILRIPKDWITLYNEEQASCIDIHVCGDCCKKIFKKKRKR